MRWQKFNTTYVVSIERGEEIITSLIDLCKKENITLGSVSGIGAADEIELKHYSVTQGEYSSRRLQGEHEIAAMVGNITTLDGEPHVHVHITIGDKSFTTYSGHLGAAVVSGACEVVIQAVEGSVDRKADDATGLNLLSLE